jgi:hypothetical protein
LGAEAASAEETNCTGHKMFENRLKTCSGFIPPSVSTNGITTQEGKVNVYEEGDSLRHESPGEWSNAPNSINVHDTLLYCKIFFYINDCLTSAQTLLVMTYFTPGIE